MAVMSCGAQCERQATLTVSSKLICGEHPSDKAELLQANDLIPTIQSEWHMASWKNSRQEFNTFSSETALIQDTPKVKTNKNTQVPVECQQKKNPNIKTKQYEELHAQGMPTQWKEISKQLINLVTYSSFCYSCLTKGPIFATEILAILLLQKDVV